MVPRLAISLAVLAACRRDPDHAVSRVASGPPPRPTVTTRDAATPPGAPQVRPPPGSDRVVPVPAAVVAHVALRKVIDGLERPVALVAAPGDPRRRLFIVEQHAARIRILEGGKLAARPFFALTGRVSTGNEQGLLGLAFHPDFARNGKLYVDYTAPDKDTHIVEYRVSARDPDVVDPATARELIEIDQPYSNHNGGNLVFGPDGKLYVGTGDGGSGGDPRGNGQNPTALLGKMLRFDVDVAAPSPEIVHLGLRNPWRYAFDVASGGLYIGDVGQNAWEYVHVAPIDVTGLNFGWNVVEGNHCYDHDPCDKARFTLPVAEYPHAEGCSITGGVVYRGQALPALVGRYFYADYCTGLLRSFVWTRDRSSPAAPGWIHDHWDWKPALDHDGVLSQISSFGVDHAGELYLVELTGAIYQLVPR